MNDPSLWDAVESAPAPKTIQERFLDFHGRHPDVFVELVRLARQVRSRGRKVGIKTLWERMRWSFEIEIGTDWKLNNNFTSRYARLMIEKYPTEFSGFFETRELKAK